MSKLNKLYQAMENLKELGLKINDDLVEEVNKLEEDIIRREILPVLVEKIEPILSLVERELVLIVDYVPHQPMSVRISRKRNLTAEIPGAKLIELNPQQYVTKEFHKDDFKEHNSKSRNLSNKTTLKVYRPDGTTIEESKAAHTMGKVVKELGVEKVKKLDIKLDGLNIILEAEKIPYPNQQFYLGNHLFLNTHSCTERKKKHLEKIFNMLNVKWKVEII